MASVAPKSVAAEVSEARKAIEDSMYSTYVVDQFSSEKLRRRIQSVLSQPGLSNSHKAILHHELAYLFGILGKFPEAMEQASLMANYGIGQVAAGYAMAHLAQLNGQVLISRGIIEDLSKAEDLGDSPAGLIAAHQAMSGMLKDALKNTSPSVMHFDHINSAVKILDAIGVSDIEVTMRLDTACRVIRENINHPILAYKLFAMEGEGILYRYVVNSTVDDLIAINDKVLDALLDHHDGPLDRELSICVTPWSDIENLGAVEAYHVSIV
jgi:hypothetical protein